MNRPVFLSDLGIVSALGTGKVANAERLFAGDSEGLVSRDGLIPGEPAVVGAVRGMPTDLGHLPERYRSPTHALLEIALSAIGEAVRAAVARFGAPRVAVVLGTSTSGVAATDAALAVHSRTGVWPTEFDWHVEELGGIAEFAASRIGAEGPALVVSTACSSSAKAFASARRLIHAGIVDAVLVGGADSLSRMTVSGFRALELTAPGRCRPFSLNRDGINVGEGAAVFLMTTEPSAIRLAGIGESTDAYHVSAPDPEGKGAAAAMATALADAGLAASDLAYVNLHGTGTTLNDAMEAGVVAALIGDRVPCGSTKGMTGHTLGAAGAIEAAFLWLSLSKSFGGERLPPHVWDGVADPALPPLQLAPTGLRRQGGPTAMLSNSFAFGGSNCAVILAS